FGSCSSRAPAFHMCTGTRSTAKDTEMREYETLADRFVPAPNAARAWAALARRAGVKYIVMTTKHHVRSAAKAEGFVRRARRPHMWSGVRAATIAVALVALCSPLRAQTSSGEVNGTVADASGGVLPGATVTLTNRGTGLANTAVTNGSGNFVFVNVQSGT